MGLSPGTVGNSAAELPMRVLTPEGHLEGDLPSGLDEEKLQEAYSWMVRMRLFDSRCLLLQRQGRLGTYPPLSGQEACQVGSALPLRKSDWVVPTYRDGGAMMIHGVPIKSLLRYWMGDEWGSYMPDVRCLPIVIPIATQLPHAVGLAWSEQRKGTDNVVVGLFGDGATSEGDFHEALNFAGVFRLPVIFFCENNGYAISVPFHRQSAAPIALRACGYGMPGVRVDGNDFMAVYGAMRNAVERARSGEGPTLIEAITYRCGPHTTADDPTRYRSEDESKLWQEQRDPIVRFRRFLEAEKLWNDELEDKLQSETRAEIAAAVSEIEALPPSPASDMFDYVYAQRPWFLDEQRAILLAEIEEDKSDG